MNTAEWMTAHDYISEAALEAKTEKEQFERNLEVDFRRVFTEDLGLFFAREVN